MGKHSITIFLKNQIKLKHKEPERKTHEDTNVKLACWASLLVGMQNDNVALEERQAVFANE